MSVNLAAAMLHVAQVHIHSKFVISHDMTAVCGKSACHAALLANNV